MTLKEAIEQRIPRVRLPQWASGAVYLRLPLMADGMHGPLAELYDDFTQAEILHVRPGSQRIPAFGDQSDNWEPFAGSISTFEKDPENFAHRYAEE